MFLHLETYFRMTHDSPFTARDSPFTIQKIILSLHFGLVHRQKAPNTRQSAMMYNRLTGFLFRYRGLLNPESLGVFTGIRIKFSCFEYWSPIRNHGFLLTGRIFVLTLPILPDIRMRFAEKLVFPDQQCYHKIDTNT